MAMQSLRLAGQLQAGVTDVVVLFVFPESISAILIVGTNAYILVPHYHLV